MLEGLHIRNLAVVAELDVDFGPGLNVVTGETGAGKSLILGALQLLLGDRASPSVIRQGAAQCEIAARLRFADIDPELRATLGAFLEENGIVRDDDGELLIRRVITPSGSRNFIAAAPVPLQLLRQLGELLIDIHGPNDHQSLLQPRCQLALLDSFAGLEKDVAACQAAFAALEAERARLETLRREHLSPQEEEFLRFQLAEITAAALQPGEDAELGARHALVAHRRALLDAAGECRQGLTEADGAAVEPLRAALRQLDEIEQVDAEHGAAFRERLESFIAGIQELSDDLERYAGTLDLDESELARLEERLGVLQKLKRKYGPTLDAVGAMAAAFQERLGTMEKRQETLDSLAAECARQETAHRALCSRLSAARRTAGARLAAAIIEKLQRLGFAQGLFEARLADVAPGPRGADHAEFCFAPNPGEALLPLRQIASSGEIARVMLAIKTILSHADRVPVLIFDEVDANIGGRVAVKVADELAAIARRHQVLCITHLPQIAAAGDRHYRVSKSYVAGRTLAEMRLLDAPGREQEITRMLGAADDSTVGRDHARDMLARQARAAPAVAAAAASGPPRKGGKGVAARAKGDRNTRHG